MAPPAQTREEAEDGAVRQATGGGAGALRRASLRRLAGDSYDRCHEPAGVARQLAGHPGVGQPSSGLATLAIPTLVIHGTADPLVQSSGGERTAEVIPDAELLMVDGMGHDLPPPCGPPGRRHLRPLAEHQPTA